MNSYSKKTADSPSRAAAEQAGAGQTLAAVKPFDAKAGISPITQRMATDEDKSDMDDAADMPTTDEDKLSDGA